MRISTFTLMLLLLATVSLSAQMDFFGRNFSGQSPNSAENFLVAGLGNEISLINNQANLREFEHATRQIELFNLGIGYAAEILEDDSLEEIQIDLDTVVGGRFTQNTFRYFAGLQYKALDREQLTTLNFGGSRFQDGGLSVSLRHDFSTLAEDQVIEVVPAIVTDRSVFASFYAGLEGGFDSGFSVSLEESGILQIVSDHLIRDVAEGNLTFEEYKEIERDLHGSIRYEAPRNTGGSEWFMLALLKGQLYTTPFNGLPLKFVLGAEYGFDITRLRNRNQSRFGMFIRVGYLFF